MNRKKVFMRLGKRRWIALAVVAAISALFMPSQASAQASAAQSSAALQWFSDGSTILSTMSSLLRGDEQLKIEVNTAELTPGNAVTLWWIIFNNPAECSASCGEDDLFDEDVAASIVHADGEVVGRSGRAHYSDVLAKGVEPSFGGTPFGFGPGVVNTWGAEVLALVLDHGAAETDPEKLERQLTTFLDCLQDPSPCTDLQFAVHK